MKPKKVCIVTPEYPPDQWGGLARTVRRVAGHARDMGIDVHVAHMTIAERETVLLDENRRDERCDGILVHHLEAGRENLADRPLTIWDFAHTRVLKMMYQSLELLHDQEGFDLFHGFFLYPTGYIAGLLARKARVPSIVTVVGNDVHKYLFSPELVGCCRSGLENADRVAALSHDLLISADALVPVAHKGRIIFNGVEPPAVAWAPRPLAGRALRIGCAGIFKYAKGLPYLFKAVARLRCRHDIVLELVGTLRDSERRSFHDMVATTGIGDILTFPSALAHDQMPAWLCGLDLFVLPSVSEGCPTVLMEAMACGVPCVATRVGAVADLMEDGRSGLIVPRGNAQALAEAMERILRMPDAGLSLGQAARRRMGDFSLQREKMQWQALYREVGLP